MNTQNEIKRTLIAFSLALSLAIVGFALQHKKGNQSKDTQKLEAQIYQDKEMLMEK